jgi:hypothetical protein
LGMRVAPIAAALLQTPSTGSTQSDSSARMTLANLLTEVVATRE